MARLLLGTLFGAFVLFLYGPTLTIVVLAFGGPESGLTFPLQGVSLHWFGQLFADQAVGNLGAALQRSLALALRLAGHQLVQITRSVDPLLLLDDIFSELDPQRSDRLLQLLPAGQTLVTTASPLPSTMSPAVVVNLERTLK